MGNPSAKLPATRAFGNYEIIRDIAKGTVGEVYLAKRVGTAASEQVPYVLKTFNPKLVMAQSDLDLFEEPLHRCLIQYRQVGFNAEADRYFTVMDRLNVEPHSNPLFRQTKLNFKQKLKRFVQLAEGIAIVHDHGRFHGALKPSNILVRKPETEYHMIATDFGFWYRHDPTYYKASEQYFEGWLFTPPETILEAVPSFWPKHGRPPKPCPASDVYAWAVIMIYSLNGGRDGFYHIADKNTGESRFDERVRNDLAVLYQKKLDVSERWTLVVGKKEEIDRDKFIEFTFKCLEPDPRDRYATMGEALEAFRGCLSSAG